MRHGVHTEYFIETLATCSECSVARSDIALLILWIGRHAVLRHSLRPSLTHLWIRNPCNHQLRSWLHMLGGGRLGISPCAVADTSHVRYDNRAANTLRMFGICTMLQHHRPQIVHFGSGRFHSANLSSNEPPVELNGAYAA